MANKVNGGGIYFAELTASPIASDGFCILFLPFFACPFEPSQPQPASEPTQVPACAPTLMKVTLQRGLGAET